MWRRGSVIASWLLDLTATALLEDPSLSKFAGRVSDSGEGRWTIMAAIDEAVPAPVLTAALYARFSSRGEADFQNQLLSAMRFQFGGHVEKAAHEVDRVSTGCDMGDTHSDALVFFGATGDLAYKKIFPSLQAMAKRGHLNVPVIGVAKAGWTLDQLRARAQESVEKYGGLDRAAFAKLSGLLRYVDGDYKDPATFRGASTRARRRRAPRALPGDPAPALRTRRGATGSIGVRERGPRRRRETLRRGPRLGARPESDPARHVRGARHLPHRPLPRKAPRSQHAVLSLLESGPRGLLESDPRRERADHDGGGLRHPGTRRLLRRDGRDPRRRSESPLPAVEQSRDGAAGANGQRVPAGRKGESPEVHSRSGGRGRRSRTIPRVPAGARRRRRFAGRDVRRCPAPYRFGAVAGRPVLHPHRKVPPDDVHGGRRPPAAASNGVSVPERCSAAELLPISNRPAADDRVRRHGDG